MIGDISRFDLKNPGDRRVSYQEAQEFAAEYNINYMEVNLSTGYNLKETFDIICDNLVEIAIRKRKAVKNPEPFSCCGCLVESCIWGVCLYRNRNIKKFFKALGYFLLFHISVFILS